MLLFTATIKAVVPQTAVVASAAAAFAMHIYTYSCCSRDRGCYIFPKTDATSLAVFPGTEVATWSLKLMLHP